MKITNAIIRKEIFLLLITCLLFLGSRTVLSINKFYKKPITKNDCVTYHYPDYVERLYQQNKQFLPFHKTRNISRHQFTVSNSATQLTRKSQPFDIFTWQDLLSGPNGLNSAHQFKQSLPEVMGVGLLNYNIYESWYWQSCDLIQGGVCGAYYQCDDFLTEDNLTRDQQKQFNCQRVNKSCYKDISHSESEFCSKETMTYEYHFKRPAHKDWNPETPGYEPFLANKYDLLEGEKEIFTIRTGTKLSVKSTLGSFKPEWIFNQQYNQYAVNLKGSAITSPSIKPHQDKHLFIEIDTVHRILSRSPNILDLPQTHDGEDIPVINWKSAQNKNQLIENAIPSELNLLNKSAETINYFTQSRQKKSFERKISIKVKLIETGNFWRLWINKELGEMVISENDVILPSLNAFSKDNSIQAADLLKIPLEQTDFTKNVYADKKTWFVKLFSLSYFKRHLKPNHVYYFYVSVYFEKFQFYKKQPKKIGFFDSQDHYYSDPLIIKFKTKSHLDQRSFFEIIEDPTYFTLRASLKIGRFWYNHRTHKIRT